MLIRSQNRQNIFNINTIGGIGFCQYEDYQIYALVNGIEYLIGSYSSKEKAIKVLDMIEEEYQTPTYINDEGGGEYANYWQKVFHMPDDEEVE